MIPLRKVNEKRVALTSYYGKVFIERSEKRVNNYLKWLANQIRSASLDKENKQITETRTGNVYDHLVDTPYLYSGLSKEFRTITTFNGLTFYFDYHKRLAKLASESIENAKRFETAIPSVVVIVKVNSYSWIKKVTYMYRLL